MDEERIDRMTWAIVDKIQEIVQGKAHLDYETQQVLIAAGELLLHYQPREESDDGNGD